ncbi:MBL fold metallo-hydrolase [Thioclava kandeliae]|uniref:MBL fold metallo-hydrolase n=1 Tax=Thioclava kandeliae TaxID=3070818 RepID=A0ABV1SET0_9RHOB
MHMSDENSAPGQRRGQISLPDGIRHVLAPNPSPMTHQGTNSYILGRGDVAVVDPGPMEASHLAALQSCLAPGERIAAVLVTHSHVDHSASARALAVAHNAPVYGFGGVTAGRSALMEQLAEEGHLGGGEGVDHGFTPDITLADGDCLDLGGMSVSAHHTPGHFGNHLSFEIGDTVLTGDIVMGWTSTVISPPDGDLGSYFRALDRLQACKATLFLPGHGDPVREPAKRIDDLRAHRLARHAQILNVLTAGPASAQGIAMQVYGDLPPRVMAAATRNCLAHLIDMMEKDQVSVDGVITDRAIFGLR